MTQPKIVVLDGHTTNPGDISWAPLQRLGELTVHARSEPSDVISRLSGAQLTLTNKVLLPEAVLTALPKLEFVGIMATGTNAVDLDAATRRGIVVSNVPRYGTNAVAQLVIEALLDATLHAHEHRQAVRNGAWEKAADFCFNVAPVRELEGMTLGIVGYGAIGRKVAEVASSLGMRILVAESFRDGDPARADPARAAPALGDPARQPLSRLLQSADFITLHCPLTPRTRGLIAQRELDSMKPSAVLINTARGPLIDEQALAAALSRGRIARAYLDVLSQEPPPANHPLLHHPQCWVTPHIGWTSREARERLIEQSARNIEGFLQGKPINVVS